MIRRVSSRQRLVSWDAFDATANPNAEATSSSEEEDYCNQSSPCSSSSRKRERSTTTKKKKMSPPMSVLNLSSSLNVPAFPWEFASFQSPPIDGLPEDLFLEVCTFLDLSSVRNAMILNHKFRYLLLNANAFWRQHCQRLWQGLMTSCHEFQDSTQIPTVVHGPQFQMTANLPFLIHLTPKKLPWKVDESLLGTCRKVQRTFRMDHSRMRIIERQVTPDSTEETLVLHSNKSIQYTGRVGAGDRCIRSNHPLPRPTRLGGNRKKNPSILDMLCRSGQNIQENSCLSVWRPFVCPYRSGKTLQVGPRMVAYFEVSILENPSSTKSARDCVAVGVATESFSCQTRMPGWDAQSFGYHGDDGGTFHASGGMLERFGPCFGTGDTVGCGIDYVARGIFFTLNGNFLGYGWKQIDSEFLEHDLYGVVGIDTNDPVAVNYGAKPFQFNLNKFTKKHDLLIARQYQHAKVEESELADLPSYPEI